MVGRLRVGLQSLAQEVLGGRTQESRSAGVVEDSVWGREEGGAPGRRRQTRLQHVLWEMMACAQAEVFGQLRRCPDTSGT